MTQWEPIETAPKDGTRILLWAGDATIGEFGANDEWMISLDAAVMPTHWMKLPEPPESV